MKIRPCIAAAALAALAALAGCAAQEPTRLAQSDCHVVSVAGGQPLKVHYAYERREPNDPRTSEHRLHQQGDCRNAP